MGPTSATYVAAYLALFFGVGFLFLFVNLLVGKFLRPAMPEPEKLEVYECGEPTIGSSFVQFDLRFYVVALLFIIFDVEVAMFFPWAAVFGKATHLMDPALAVMADDGTALTGHAAALIGQFGVPEPAAPLDGAGAAANEAAVRQSATLLAAMSIGDILVFFGVLMVGFAYVWRRGDLDWVRAVSRQRQAAAAPPRGGAEKEPALVA